MNRARIAVVGMACRYPDADTPDRLWENVLAGRRAFRRLPDVRTRLDDYYAPDPDVPDRFYAAMAAVLEGFEFDRVRYRIAGSTYRSTDPVHWLALDTAAKALEDARLPGGAGIPAESTGVVVGNTLTGEFSRANVLRLRWPYVRRTVAAALRELEWTGDRLRPFLDELERRYKTPFPEIDEDSLAGGLANTIAGRICNYFDFRGGGYTVDGACSSSLLSVATACTALADGDLDAAIAGGVDLSIDPFELVGFAKTGALARDEMRVYDRGSNGFWPGEGCGMLVLMRDEDAVARGLRRHATIAGWGYSSDGAGGMTRPEVAGHRLALRRAYRMAGFGIGDVGYLEGHGTGTAVGDAAELCALGEALSEAGPGVAPVAIGTVKANIGHTKAAAGVAGLIKAVLAVRHGLIPPVSGHSAAHPELTGDRPVLRVPDAAEPWPGGGPPRAGVSSMGFGGINAHVVVEHADGAGTSPAAARTLVRSRQDAELLLLDAETPLELAAEARRLAGTADMVSFAELGDLAAALARGLSGGPVRAAVVAGTPATTGDALRLLADAVADGSRELVDPRRGIFLGSGTSRPRIGFLFPGQGAGRRGDGGALRRRFAAADRLYECARLPVDGDLTATELAQPRIVTSSAAGLRVLGELGIEAAASAGHSLGELTALHWAGGMAEDVLLRIAEARGRIMAATGIGDGTMAGIGASPDQVRPLLAGEPVTIAGYNGPRQTVVSGPKDAVWAVSMLAADRGFTVSPIAVSHAFHSAEMGPAGTRLRAWLDEKAGFRRLRRTVFSTVTGVRLPPGTDLPELLERQILAPVRFADAVTALAGHCDLLLEVGPGRTLTGLAAQIAPECPAVALETDSRSLGGLLRGVAAAYALGAPVAVRALFDGRFTRPFPLDKEFSFLANPCEAAPVDHGSVEQAAIERVEPLPPSGGRGNPVDVLRRLAAERAELPLDAVGADTHPLDDLHLSSITVGQIVGDAVRELGIGAPVSATAYATASLTDLGEMLDELRSTSTGRDEAAPAEVPGVAPWVRAFRVDLDESVPGRAPAERVAGTWQLVVPEPYPLAKLLAGLLEDAALGNGVLLCLRADCGEDEAEAMLAAARAALALAKPARFVAVGGPRGAGALAKTLHLEAPWITTSVITLPCPEDLVGEEAEAASERILRVVAGTGGFGETVFDAAGIARTPVLRVLPCFPDEAVAPVLAPDDVMLVTGGGKGITAECALALAAESGAALALLGRSSPSEDAALAANLERIEASGVRVRYYRADVTASGEVAEAVALIGRELGPVSVVLHGAGHNEPRPLAKLEAPAFRRTLAPKVGGLRTVLSAVAPRLLVTFGSVIGRAGLRGQADYAIANDWLTELAERYGRERPECRCVALEWSVWSGTGMGERLGVLEALVREGIQPIPAAAGVAMLRRVLGEPEAPGAVVVAGRSGGLPTVRQQRDELPLLRFLERTRVHCPGVELVAEAGLSAGGDPYLADHVLDGNPVFPAVLGMEAICQVASALAGRTDVKALEDAEFLRPVVVPPGETRTIRIAALAVAGDVVRVAVRAAETDFVADHFRATVRFGQSKAGEPVPARAVSPLPLDPATDLYGSVLFQGNRFRRLSAYRVLAATSCVAEIAPGPADQWFGGFLPAGLVLGDPGRRDALMHAVQCCVPDTTLLPVRVGKLEIFPGAGDGAVTVTASERGHDGDTYVYDLTVRDSRGVPAERWSGLELRAVARRDVREPWPPVLLGPYLARRCAAWVPGAPGCAVVPDERGLSRRERSAAAITAAAGGEGTVVRYRPDGRPEAGRGLQVSASHGAGVTFAVAGAAPVGCDVQPLMSDGGQRWPALLDADGLALARLAGRKSGEAFGRSAGRVWSAVECLRKLGHAVVREPLVFDGTERDGWVRFRSGSVRIATWVGTLRQAADPVVFSVAAGDGP
ncbi:type I polyketide synthase [Amycolatopsis vastitatis]|uniref:Erythronolide synthase n=1 Tax=Amycolatopsis vastitatis TaxID=1905142 RepID=A0A229T5P0_9PSEU|nr:type I polyketide synthase [Amycolatopsis vastitatis]OXM66079.1 erythronolide synthase [Amycolatopsis vastitatis]